MRRRTAAFVRWFVAVAATCMLGCAPEEATDEARPNLVLIVVDTLRGDFVHEEPGVDRHATPRLDALAERGIAFPRAYAHAPATLPSHTALFSSRLPHQSGVTYNHQEVPADLPLLSEWLGRAGYATGAVVSLGTLRPNRPGLGLQRGFDHFDDSLRGAPPAEVVVERLGRTLDSLKEAGGPFFLFAHFSDPHTPYNAHGTMDLSARIRFAGEELAELDIARLAIHEAELARSDETRTLEIDADVAFRVRGLHLRGARGGDVPTRVVEGALAHPIERLRVEIEPWDAAAFGETARLEVWLHDVWDLATVPDRYEVEVAYVDGQVGALLDELDARGHLASSIVLFTSDHGEALGERGMVGHGRRLYEEQVHVPLILTLPDGRAIPDALRAAAEGPVSHLDLAPTLLHLLDLSPLPDQAGRSLLSPASEPRPIVSMIDHPLEPRTFSMYDARYKLLYVPDTDFFALFDLERHPDESVNVFEQEGDRFGAWQERLRAIAAERVETRGTIDELDPDVVEELNALGY